MKKGGVWDCLRRWREVVWRKAGGVAPTSLDLEVERIKADMVVALVKADPNCRCLDGECMIETEFRADCGGLVVCPFCGECDFDLPGLKSHLLNDCGSFARIEDIRRI